MQICINYNIMFVVFLDHELYVHVYIRVNKFVKHCLKFGNT